MRLADSRPAPEQLTGFYLWVALGGAVGGLLNSIVSPLVFTSVAEYPLTLAALAVLIGIAHGAATLVSMREEWTTRARAVALVMTGATLTGILAIIAVGLLSGSRRALFPLACVLSAIFIVGGFHLTDRVVAQRRSFFGVSRVTETRAARLLIHGVTVHGAQLRDPALRMLPVAYYHPDGPLGSTVLQLPDRADIGVVGLGAGSLAALTKPDQRLTFFEIDPVVEQMARQDFTFLKNAPAHVSVFIGDGRTLLAARPDGSFDALILDAFSSDAIPTHLLTDEAIDMFLRKVRPGGLVVFHISNRYADLTRVFRGWAAHSGHRVAMSQFVPDSLQQALGVYGTTAVAIAHTARGLAALAAGKRWYWLDSSGPAVHWTDDHINVLGVMNSNVLRP